MVFCYFLFSLSLSRLFSAFLCFLLSLFLCFFFRFFRFLIFLPEPSGESARRRRETAWDQKKAASNISIRITRLDQAVRVNNKCPKTK